MSETFTCKLECRRELTCTSAKYNERCGNFVRKPHTAENLPDWMIRPYTRESVHAEVLTRISELKEARYVQQ